MLLVKKSYCLCLYVNMWVTLTISKQHNQLWNRQVLTCKRRFDFHKSKQEVLEQQRTDKDTNTFIWDKKVHFNVCKRKWCFNLPKIILIRSQLKFLFCVIFSKRTKFMTKELFFFFKSIHTDNLLSSQVKALQTLLLKPAKQIKYCKEFLEIQTKFWHIMKFKFTILISRTVVSVDDSCDLYSKQLGFVLKVCEKAAYV